MSGPAAKGPEPENRSEVARLPPVPGDPTLPTLTRLLLVLLLLGAAGYGAVYALANLVEPREHQIEVRVKKDGFGR